MEPNLNPLLPQYPTPHPPTRLPPVPPGCLDPRTRLGGAHQPVEPGSLIVLDGSFRCDAFEEGHGSAVSRAAREAGYRGNIRQIADLAATDTAGIDRPGLNAEQARAAFQAHARDQVTGMLHRHSGTLDTLAATGTRNSTLNISSGLSQSDLLRNLLQTIRQDDRMPGLPRNAERDGNAERAFGINIERLLSTDPHLSIPEQQRLMQALVDSNQQALEGNPQVEAARQRYATSIRRFESANNSVVVSTTNPNLSDDFPGVRYPEGFHRSYNITDQVTAVGARPEAGWAASPGDADHAIYGRGQVWDRMGPPFLPLEGNRAGTSFAAPRTAALTAELHRRHPQLSSAQVETLLRNQFTSQNEGRTELDDNAASRYLRGLH